MTPDRLIARGGKIPWHVPEDLRIFNRVTTGKTVVMGRITYETHGKALRDRRNIVLTTDPSWWAEDATVIHSPKALIGVVSLREDIFIIGGAEIYDEFLPQIDELHVSTIYKDIPDVGYPIYFPEYQHIFDHYEMVQRYSDFEYGIWRRSKGHGDPIPTGRPRYLKKGNTENIPTNKQTNTKCAHFLSVSEKVITVGNTM